jgi:hypothetical protein
MKIPIIRSPNNLFESSKRENISRSYLCLGHILLELDNEDRVHVKLQHLSLFRSLGEFFTNCSHTLHYRETSLRNIITCSSSPNERQVSRKWSLRDSSPWTYASQPCVISSFFMAMMFRGYTWKLIESYFSWHTHDRLNSSMNNLQTLNE